MSGDLSPNELESPSLRTRNGLFYALVAYLTWGFLPAYFLLIDDVDSVELLLHRVVWAIPFGAAIIYLRSQWGEVLAALRSWRTLKMLIATSILIATNWLVYIIAVISDQIFQASLGYYINPLLFALAGVMIMGEQLRRLQTSAILLAAIGVLVLAVSGGVIPWIALFLGISFAAYGVLRKMVVVGAMPGLFVETILLFPFFVVWLGWLIATGQAAFLEEGAGTSALLIIAGPLTVIPLLCFALAARRLDLSMVGMMQFIAPTLQFLVGLWNGEPLTRAHIICFACIWTAVALFSWDVWRNRESE